MILIYIIIYNNNNNSNNNNNKNFNLFYQSCGNSSHVSTAVINLEAEAFLKMDAFIRIFYQY
jgi:hypothetical protein